MAVRNGRTITYNQGLACTHFKFRLIETKNHLKTLSRIKSGQAIGGEERCPDLSGLRGVHDAASAQTGNSKHASSSSTPHGDCQIPVIAESFHRQAIPIP